MPKFWKEGAVTLDGSKRKVNFELSNGLRESDLVLL